MFKPEKCALTLMILGAGIVGAQVGVITTYAGSSSGSLNNGIPATSATISNPIGLAVDSAGNLYIAAAGDGLIRQVNAATGIITTVAGGGTGSDGGLATAAALDGPCDVKVDSSGNLYITETCVVAEGGSGSGGGGGSSGNGPFPGVIARVRFVNAATGIITTIAGGTTGGFAGDGGPAVDALMNTPTGLAIDASGNIFVADSGNNRIRRIDAVSAIITTVAGNGTAAFAGDGGPATSASLNAPSGLTFDSSGNLYIADNGNNRIRRVDAITGNISTVAGTGSTGFNGDGISATSANITAASLVFNSSSYLVFGDYMNLRVRMIDQNGLIWTIAGDGESSPLNYGGSSIGDNGQATAAVLNRPAGLAFQPNGPMFISEVSGNRVRQVALPSVVAATAVTVSSSANPSAPEVPVTITATLAATNGAPYNATGLVVIFDALANTQIGGGPVTNGSFQFSTSTPTEGTHNLSALYLGDSNFGASSSPVYPLSISAVPPTITLAASPNPALANQSVTLTATVSPSSATGSVTFYNNNPVLGTSTLGTVSLNAGVAALITSFAQGGYWLTAQYSPNTYQYTQATSSTVSLAVKANSSLALTSSANPSNPSQSVTFTATISPSTATGMVQFLDGTAVLGTATISSGVATFSTAGLSGGQHAITANYSGDTNDTSASGTLNQAVLITTVATVTASPNPALTNASVTLTATVAPSSVTGTVQFLDGTTVLGSASLSNGSASLSTSTLSQGTHSITASYAATSTTAAATSPVFSEVIKSPAGLTTAISPASPATGQTVTFTATVNSAATGTVQFSDGSNVLATVNVSSGVATYSTSTLAAGSHTIGFNYSGDGTYMSQSATSTLTVLSSTTVTLASNPNPAFSNTQVTFSATVSPATATGTVQFLDGATVLGSVSVSGGSAVFSTSSLNQGTHSITAAYSGDTNDGTSTSGVLIQSMKSSAGMTTGASPIPPVVGQTVTFTANVNSAATGTVQFVDGSNVLATVTVVSGTASYSTSTLAAGSHNFTFNYSGDANYMGQSTTFAFTVLTATTTTLASSVNPATSGQSVTFTATVSPAASTGTLQFYAGSTSLGTATLSSGVATLSTSSLTQGNNTIVAQYSGDSTHAASSGSFSESVKSSAGLTGGVSPSPAVAGQTVTLTATLNSAATGTVTFLDGSNSLATVTVSSGKAFYSTATLAAGSHSIGFSYSGDSNYFAASTTVPESILAASTVSLSSSANPSTVGQGVTFTASVTPATATGTIQFLDNGSVIGAATLSSGTATFSISTLAQGTQSIVASYSGDSNDAAATSSTLSQVVNAAAPAAPSSLSASAASSSQINLAWTASSTSGVTYDVYESTTSGFTRSSSNRVASGLTSTSYSATGLSGSTTYYFLVSAVKGGVESAASNQASATTSGGFACHVSYSVSSQWNNGFNGAFSIENTGSTTISSWTIAWTWAGNQEVTESWNANYKQSGANVTMTSMSYNGSIAPGATLSGMGFGASYSGTNTSPTSFTVNGTVCH